MRERGVPPSSIAGIAPYISADGVHKPAPFCESLSSFVPSQVAIFKSVYDGNTLHFSHLMYLTRIP